jgi:hypothetical protein
MDDLHQLEPDPEVFGLDVPLTGASSGATTMLWRSTELDIAAERLIEVFEKLRSSEHKARAGLTEGATVREVVTQELLCARAAARGALAEVAEALRRSRSAKIRALVDDEGLTIVQVSRLLGHPRQLVKRLYDNGRIDGESLSGQTTADGPRGARRE